MLQGGFFCSLISLVVLGWFLILDLGFAFDFCLFGFGFDTFATFSVVVVEFCCFS